MTETFIIEADVPIPVHSGYGYGYGYGYGKQHPRSMAAKLRALLKAPIGSSLMLDGVKMASACNAARSIGVTRQQFTYRTVEGGTRVWRIA